MTRRELDDSVLAAALALIDDVYGTAGSANEQLCQRLYLRLQQEAVQTKRDRGAGASEATPLVDEWARIAMRQRHERDQAVQTNAAMRDAVVHQRQLALAIAALLSICQMSLRSIIPMTLEMAKRPLTDGVPLRLARRLHSVRDQFLSPPVKTTFQNEYALASQVSETRVQREHRMTAIYPFKLSCVVNDLWRMVNEDAFGDVAGQLDHDHQAYTVTWNQSNPLGRMDMEGPTAVQRTYLSDGSVLLVSVLVSTGASTPGNLLAELEIHETVWFRIGRCDMANPRSRVFVEIVTQVQVHAPTTCQMPSAELTTRLQRVKNLLDRSDTDGTRTRQRLENRFLLSSR